MSKLSRMTDKDKVEVLMNLANKGRGTVKVFDLLTALETMTRVNRAVFMTRQSGTMLKATRDGKKVVSYTVLKGSMTAPKVAKVATAKSIVKQPVPTPMPMSAPLQGAVKMKAEAVVVASSTTTNGDDRTLPEFLRR